MRFLHFLRASWKKTAKTACGIAVGTALGGVVLPRLLFPENFNATYPPILWHAALWFAAGFCTSFLVLLFLKGLGALLKKK